MMQIAEDSAGYSTGGDRAPLPESALARLWQQRAVHQDWLRTSKGSLVRVLYPGRPGKTAGPDFRNALLEFAGVGLVRGDVEIHRRQQDWNSHGHGNDPNYNGVVLHVALDLVPSPTSLRSGGEAPVVSLRPLLAGGNGSTASSPFPRVTESIWQVLGPLGYPRPDSASGMATLLERAGDARFRAKGQRFRIFFGEQDPGQTLYEGLFEALGYRQNQQPFVKLAIAAPYSVLGQAAREIEKDQRALAVESWLLQLSGLGLTLGKAGVERSGLDFGRPMSGREWHCFRVRPANHPRRRISGAARLIVRFLDGGLLAGLGAWVDANNLRKLTGALTVVHGGNTYIGTWRAKEMAVNVVLPFHYALALSQGETGKVARSLELYHRFGKLSENEITRAMTDLLIDPSWGKLVNTARRQQGLIHLHRLLSGAAS